MRKMVRSRRSMRPARKMAVIIRPSSAPKAANVPAVFLGDRLLTRVPMKLVRGVAATLFAFLGTATLLGAGASFGV